MENKINLAIEKIINISKENNNIIPDNEYISKNIISVRVLSKHFKELNNEPWIGYLRKIGLCKKGDFKLKSGLYVSPESLDINIIYELFDTFKINNNKVAQITDCNLSNNLPSWDAISKIIDQSNITPHEFFNNIGRQDKPRANKKYFNKYLKVYKEECDNKGRPLYAYEVDEHKLLPTTNWLINNYPDKNIKTYNDFVIACGYKPFKNIPKDIATKIILDMQSKLDRPINATDFQHPKENEIGIRTIYAIWGEVYIMQEELGLKVTGKHANEKTILELEDDLIRVCNTIYINENRKTITYNDIKSLDFTSYPSTYNRRLQDEENLTLREYLDSIGFKLQEEGNGLNYKFDDGENIKSQYELDFSTYLRCNLNLKYNIDYFRDVKYKELDNTYNGNMNCDYKINYKGKILYVEIAGMLGNCNNSDFKTKIITSKNKGKYRDKLIKKELIFKKNNLDYYILFPYDLKDENFLLSIFNK